MSKTPICDKVAFDSYPYAIGGRAIPAKVVMFSVAEKLELELAELRQQVEKMKSCENCKSYDWNNNGYKDCELAYKDSLNSKCCLKWELKDA